MNKTASILMALSLCAITTAATTARAALSLPETKEAQEQGKQAGKPVVILWYGSDWMGREAASLCSEWEKLAAAGNLPVVLGQFDDKLNQPRDKRTKTGMPTQYNLPAAVVLLPDGTYYTALTGKKVKTAKAMQKALQEMMPKLQKFRAVAEKARSTKGEEAAKAAGEALRMLPFEDARKCNALLDVLRSQDPQNKTGNKEVFLQGHEATWKELNSILEAGGKGGKDRDFAGAEGAARKVLARTDLTKEARQRWLGGLAFVQREKFNAMGDNDWKDFLATCKEIVKVDSKSDYAEGARFFLDYYNTEKPFIITSYFYDSRVMPRFFDKPWKVDVTSSMEGAGDYSFVLRPAERSSNKLETRDFELLVNGKPVSGVEGKVEYGKPVVFHGVPAIPAKAKVEVRCTVRCNDGGLGCQGRIEMKKSLAH